MKPKKEYEDGTDVIKIIKWVSKHVPVFGNKKIKFTSENVRRLLKHPHKAVRWMTVSYAGERFLPTLEKHYYNEKKEVVRDIIIRKTRNLELLSYAVLNEKNQEIKRSAMKKIGHLIVKEK